MASLDSAAIAGALKELYPNGDVPREVVYKNAPFFGTCPKDTDAGGELYKVPLIYGNPQGRSATFTNAQTNQTASKYAGFEVTYVDDYGTAAVTGKVIDQTRNDRMAFVRGLKKEMDGALHQLKRSAHHALFRNGGGAIGQISTAATVASLTLLLANVEDIVFFEVGQVIQASATDGTSGATRSGTATITSIDRDAGTISTTGSNWSAQITGLAVSDFLFVQGDFGLKMAGLDAWIPAAAPGATPFFTVVRNVDSTRLGGVRYNGVGQPLVEALIDGVERVQRHGGSPDVVVVHTKQFARISKSLETKRYGTRKSEDGRFSYRTLVLETASGDVDIMGDINCQVDVAWVLQLDTWTLATMGQIPKMLDDDGMPYLRQANADGVELRTVYRGNLVCNAPGWNGRIALAA